MELPAFLRRTKKEAVLIAPKYDSVTDMYLDPIDGVWKPLMGQKLLGVHIPPSPARQPVSETVEAPDEAVYLSGLSLPDVIANPDELGAEES